MPRRRTTPTTASSLRNNGSTFSWNSPIQTQPTMKLNRDLREFVGLLNSHKVEFLVVGPHALAYHGLPRYTKDIDLFVAPRTGNADSIIRAIDEFGFASVATIRLGFPDAGHRRPARSRAVSARSAHRIVGDHMGRGMVETCPRNARRAGRLVLVERLPHQEQARFRTTPGPCGCLEASADPIVTPRPRRDKSIAGQPLFAMHTDPVTWLLIGHETRHFTPAA